MEKGSVGTYSLMIAVAVWGVLLGGVVYSNAIVMPAFLADLPSSALVVNGPYAINEAQFWMTIHPFAVFTLIAALAANWRQRRRLKLIAVTFASYVVIIIVTALYFVPELIEFSASQQSYTPAAEWASRAFRWRMLSWVRGGVMFALIIPLLFALIDRGNPSGNDGRRI